MTTVVQISFNGHGNTVVRDIPAALRHVADNLLEAGGRADLLDSLIADEGEAHGYLATVGAEPSLLHVLRRSASGRESLVLQVHDLDARPGFETAREHYDLVDARDPSFDLFEAIFKVAESDEDIDEMADDLLMRAEGSVRAARGLVTDDARTLATLRAQQAMVGYPAGHPFRIVPDAAEGEVPSAILAAIPGTAVARFREVISKIDLNTGPAP